MIPNIKAIKTYILFKCLIIIISYIHYFLFLYFNINLLLDLEYFKFHRKILFYFQILVIILIHQIDSYIRVKKIIIFFTLHHNFVGDYISYKLFIFEKTLINVKNFKFYFFIIEISFYNYIIYSYYV